MEEFLNLSRTEIENNLNNEQIRVSQIISLAMVISVLLFCGIIIIMYSQTVPPMDPQIQEMSILPTFSYVLLVLGIIIYGMFIYLPKIIYTPQRIKEMLSTPYTVNQNKNVTIPVLGLLFVHRTMMIIHLAMLEGVALFGLVALFYAIEDGIIYFNSNYWLLLTPALILFIYVIKNFPTKQKVAEQIEENILKPLRSAV